MGSSHRAHLISFRDYVQTDIVGNLSHLLLVHLTNRKYSVLKNGFVNTGQKIRLIFERIMRYNQQRF
jgi:hypothetical protein